MGGREGEKGERRRGRGWFGRGEREKRYARVLRKFQNYHPVNAGTGTRERKRNEQLVWVGCKSVSFRLNSRRFTSRRWRRKKVNNDGRGWLNPFRNRRRERSQPPARSVYFRMLRSHL